MTNDLELYEIYFKESKQFYLDKLVKYENGQKISFNAAAFFFGLLWFLYRKMYVEALIIVFVFAVDSYLETTSLVKNAGQNFIRIFYFIKPVAIATITGFIGNYLYILKANRTIQTAKLKFDDHGKLEMYLDKRGGISFTVLIIFIIAIVTLYTYAKFKTHNGR